MSTGGACVPAPQCSNSNFGCTEFPVFPCYEGISNHTEWWTSASRDAAWDVRAPARGEWIWFGGALCRESENGARAGAISGPNPGTSAGRKSPDRGGQVIDSIQYFCVQNFSRKTALLSPKSPRPSTATRLFSLGGGNTVAGRTQGNGQGEEALFREPKSLNPQKILE